MLVSIVIPCYNSEKTIERVVDLCVEEFDKLEGYECEFVLVNDFSKDKTYEAICRAAAKYPCVKGINLAKNFGQHNAIMAGLNHAEGDMIIGMDDDEIRSYDDLQDALLKRKAGDKVTLKIIRDNQEKELSVVLAERP